eukprot:202251-Chlamydomonas_euryale.AAC.2
MSGMQPNGPNTHRCRIARSVRLEGVVVRVAKLTRLGRDLCGYECLLCAGRTCVAHRRVEQRASDLNDFGLATRQVSRVLTRGMERRRRVELACKK